jgi:hypothetical protein
MHALGGGQDQLQEAGGMLAVHDEPGRRALVDGDLQMLLAVPRQQVPAYGHDHARPGRLP